MKPALVAMTVSQRRTVARRGSPTSAGRGSAVDAVAALELVDDWEFCARVGVERDFAVALRPAMGDIAHASQSG